MSKLRMAFLSLAALCWIQSAVGAPSRDLTTKSPDLAVILRNLERAGAVRIIVEFAPLLPSERMRPDQETMARVEAYVRTTQDRILSRHFGDAAALRPVPFDRALKRATITPMFALNVTGAELEALAADPEVLRIHSDEPDQLQLNDTVPLVRMNQPFGGAYAFGATGQGQAIVVIDTGVDVSHPFITAGKVIGEACFSTNNTFEGAQSLCRNGADSDLDPGSAAPCSGIEGCDHGTHVAGIAAGMNSTPGAPPKSPLNGVANEAKIISVKAFTRYTEARSCPPPTSPPCILSNPMDQVLALEWVYRNEPLFNVRIAAVNISIGSGRNLSHCDNDKRYLPIENLKKINVATVIAAGNERYRDAVSAPACISAAISVASSTKDDEISDFSNMGWMVDLVAPGGALGSAISEDVLSSVPGRTYKYYAGTSMASPHVAGAIAAIRSVRPTASVDDVKKALIDTGKPIKDQRQGGKETKNRIRVDLAAGGLHLELDPQDDMAFSGPFRGPFSPSAAVYQLRASSGEVQFTVSGLSWLKIFGPTGTPFVTGTATKVPTKLVFSLDDAVKSFPPRTYVGQVTFYNQTTGTADRIVKVVLVIDARTSMLYLSPPEGQNYAVATALYTTTQPKGDVNSADPILFGYSCTSPCYDYVRTPVAWRQGKPTKIQLFEETNFGQISVISRTGTFAAGSAGSWKGSWPTSPCWPALLNVAQDVLTRLPPVPNSVGCPQITGVTSEGKVVGNVAQQSWLWISGQLLQLPPLPNGQVPTFAQAISGDGQTIVGSAPVMNSNSSHYEAVRWRTSDRSIEALGVPPGYRNSSAVDVSADGSTILVYAFNNAPGGEIGEQAFIWTAPRNWVPLGFLEMKAPRPQGNYSRAMRMSADGSRALGTSNDAFFLWDRRFGLKKLNEVLGDGGLGFEDWGGGLSISDAVISDISPDGTTISGGAYNYTQGKTGGWLARIPHESFKAPSDNK